MKKIIYLLLVPIIFALSGCAALGVSRKPDKSEQEIANLQAEIDRLNEEKNGEINRIMAENESMLKAKQDLEKRLKKEIGDYKAKLEMTERGLLITLLSEIFFDSGKDAIKPDGEKTLKDVASVLNTSVVKSNIAVEGHTDDVPIKHSSWKSNWELSTARALSVVHYFADNCGVKPERLSAVGYGEYRPVAPNKTDEGRNKNRRVEIVILPSLIEKVKSKN